MSSSLSEEAMSCAVYVYVTHNAQVVFPLSRFVFVCILYLVTGVVPGNIFSTIESQSWAYPALLALVLSRVIHALLPCLYSLMGPTSASLRLPLLYYGPCRAISGSGLMRPVDSSTI